MSLTRTKLRDVPRHILYGCTECAAKLSVPVTSDFDFIARYLWVRAGWLLSAQKDDILGETAVVTFQPLCPACQPLYVDPLVLHEARAGAERKNGPPGVN